MLINMLVDMLYGIPICSIITKHSERSRTAVRITTRSNFETLFQDKLEKREKEKICGKCN